MFREYADMVSIGELCEMLKIGTSKAYELLRNGTIRGFKEGKIWKIPRHAVVDYVMERSTRKEG